MKAEDFDKKFDDGTVDIIDDLELSTIKRPNQTQKGINVDFPANEQVGILNALLDGVCNPVQQKNFSCKLHTLNSSHKM